MKKNTERVKALRHNLTDAEKFLWQRMRNRELSGFKFRRQHPIGPYIVDFVCIEKRIIIEVDGGQHAENTELDTQRSKYLQERGNRILRFWDNEVLKEGTTVLDVILSSLAKDAPSPTPSPP